MAKQNEIDKLLEQLEQSEMLKKLILTIKRLWNHDQIIAQPINSQTVDQNVARIVEKEKVIDVPVEKIVYKDKIIEKIVEKRVEIPVEKTVEKRVEVVPAWAKSLESQLIFLKNVQAHTGLAKILLPHPNADLLILIVTASQWNNLLRVWDELDKQVKQTKQPLTAIEQEILANSLALFNLTLPEGHQATLLKPQIGDAYDYSVYQKILGSGERISEVLLAGLYNVAGDNVRSAIVNTH